MVVAATAQLAGRPGAARPLALVHAQCDRAGTAACRVAEAESETAAASLVAGYHPIKMGQPFRKRNSRTGGHGAQQPLFPSLHTLTPGGLSHFAHCVVVVVAPRSLCEQSASEDRVRLSRRASRAAAQSRRRGIKVRR